LFSLAVLDGTEREEHRGGESGRWPGLAMKNFMIGFLTTIAIAVFLIAVNMAMRLLRKRRAGRSGRQPGKSISTFRG
jgi:hypothetical protein